MSVGLLDKETLWGVLIGRQENATGEKVTKDELDVKRTFFDAMWDKVYAGYIDALNEAGANSGRIGMLGMTFIHSAKTASNFLGQIGAEAAALANQSCLQCDDEDCPMAIKLKAKESEHPKGIRIDIE